MQHPMLNIAVMAARKAGDTINHATLDLESIKINPRHSGESMSDIQDRAKKIIVEILLNAYPNHHIYHTQPTNTAHTIDSIKNIQKEMQTIAINPLSNSSKQSFPAYQWLIDPINGLNNFMHGLPQFAVSLALQIEGIITHSVIYAPATNQLFTASKGLGAYCNNRRIRVSKRNRIVDSLLSHSISKANSIQANSSAIPSIIEPAVLNALTKLNVDLNTQSIGLRNIGSPALDLAYIALGGLDACYGVHINPHEIAAGALMVTEAGGLISDALGDNHYLTTGNFLAGNPKIFSQLLPRISPVLINI